MDDTILDRHRCHASRCGRAFTLVCRRSAHDVPVPTAVACPHCCRWEVVMVPTGAVREGDGAYVLPFDHAVIALSA
jgi:hypothetical protein